jgi:hypothetical protein
MTTTINASTSSGLVTTPDNSGAIALQNNGVTGLNVSASGFVTHPLQPAFSVNVQNAGTISGDGVYVNIGVSGGTVNLNTGSYFSTSTGRFTAPVAGNYFFTAYGNPNSSVGGPAIEIYKNDTTSLAQTYIYNAAYNGSSCTVIVPLVANDYITARFIVYNGTSTAVHRAGFCGYLLS